MCESLPVQDSSGAAVESRGGTCRREREVEERGRGRLVRGDDAFPCENWLAETPGPGYHKLTHLTKLSCSSSVV